MILVPKPRKMQVFPDLFEGDCFQSICLGNFNNPVFLEELKKIKSDFNIECDAGVSLVFIEDGTLANEEYKINITQQQIKVYASKDIGVFYAIQTLKQIFKNQKIPCLVIEDAPDLCVRGVMLDISRSKVPTLDTLKQLVELFYSLKINHLELYVEGFSFEYQSFRKEIEINHNYLPLQDYLELEQYCIEHFIDLVPNQNGFGHMADWLALDEYKELAECPEGFYIWGAMRPPSTLDPTNPKSIEFVKKLYDDMLPYFSSKYFNMNFDEPFELGHGKSKKEVEKTSEAEVFIKFFNELSDYVKSYNKIPMLWGDVLLKHPEHLDKLPKDVIFIDWGYNHRYDFDKHAKTLRDKNVEFILAPGSVSWGNILGNYLDMHGSITHACEAAKKYGAKGVMVTDWGDIGHLQYLPISIPAFIYTAMKTWSDATEQELEDAVELYFNHSTLGKLIIQLSKFIPLEGEYRDYGCRLFYTILWAEHASRYSDPVAFFKDKMQYNLISEENVKKLHEFFNHALNLISNFENVLVIRELKNSIFLLKILLDINVKLTVIYKQNEDEIDFQREISLLEIYSEEHLKLWNARNIHDGYKMSNQRILWLKNLLALMKNRKEIK